MSLTLSLIYDDWGIYILNHQSCRVPKMSSSLKRWYSLSSWSLTWVPPYSGKRTLSPSLKATGIRFPFLSRVPGPTATTFPEFSCSQKRRRTITTNRLTEDISRQTMQYGKRVRIPWRSSQGGGYQQRFWKEERSSPQGPCSSSESAASPLLSLSLFLSPPPTASKNDEKQE